MMFILLAMLCFFGYQKSFVEPGIRSDCGAELKFEGIMVPTSEANAYFVRCLNEHGLTK